jgi:hypothetical protein
MILTISTSGGIGNLRIQGELDTDELDRTLADQVKSVLRPERLKSITFEPGTAMVDSSKFEVGFLLEKGVQQYTIDEANAPAEVVEVLQALVHEIILKKRQS